MDVFEQLAGYKRARDNDWITADEYTAKKKQLMGL